jgi:integrase
MARRSTGGVVEKRTRSGTSYALRFRALGRRWYVTLGSSADGWSRARAEEELANVLADVRRGIWRPPEPDPEPPVAREEPTFHEFASEWLAGRKADGLQPRTIADYRWSLTCHLLPHFAGMRLSRITVEEVDRYRRAKVREHEAGLAERPLANSTINKTLKHLAAVLDLAVEYGYLPANPARGRRRRLPAVLPRRASLVAEQVRVLLASAGGHYRRDRDFFEPRDRALLGTAIMAGGLRVSEVTGLRWRDLDLAGGWLTVAQSKTAAGLRRVELAPALLDELKAWKARTPFHEADAFVFPTKVGTRMERNNARRRVLYPAIERANAALVKAGHVPIPEHATFHSLRRTYASLMAAAGADQAYTMRQIGHRSAALTLEVYTDVNDRRHPATAKLGSLLVAPDWALTGTETPS